ncbi:MAG TPA: hypothetical protein VHA12_00105 [Candidatus Nanoarchaeia archaeon]|nr:hypothetical protein [Candidatus Nanoarchaeia archaeon]
MTFNRKLLDADLYYNRSRIVRADLQNHFRVGSGVKDTDLERAAVHATKADKLGIGGVTCLVNCEDARFEETVEKAKKRGKTLIHSLGANAVYLPEMNSFMVVKGQEIQTPQGHVLLIGVQRDTYLMHNVPFKERKLVDVLKAAKQAGAIAVIDHPFYRGGIFHTDSPAGINHRLSRQEMKELVFGYEIYNGAANFSLPKIAPSYANEKAFDEFNRIGGLRDTFPSLHTIVTSDGHSFWEIGSSNMDLPMPVYYTEMDSSEKVVDALKYGIEQANRRSLSVQHSHSSLGGALTFSSLAGLRLTGILANKLPSSLAKPIKEFYDASQGRKYQGPNYTPNH